jgi:predicted ATP-grasp superfamily ATP-dependent carboligase
VEIVERVTGVEAIAMHAAACNNSERQKTALLPQSAIRGVNHCHGKAVLFARRDFMISNEFAENTLADALRTPWPSLADISVAGTPVQTGRPILTLFAEGASVDQVESRLRERALQIERNLDVQQ